MSTMSRIIAGRSPREFFGWNLEPPASAILFAIFVGAIWKLNGREFRIEATLPDRTVLLDKNTMPIFPLAGQIEKRPVSTFGPPVRR